MLSRTLLRMLTVQVLAEIPLLRGNVEDSLIADIDAGKDANWPNILAVVYTENLQRTWGRSGRFDVDLSIEIVAGIEDIQVNANEKIILPKKLTPASELLCDTAEDEINFALNDISSDWADLWRVFANIDKPVQSFCGTDAKGRKRALRKIVLPVSVIPSPQRGCELQGIWKDALGKFDAEGSEAYKLVASAIRKIVGRGGDVADWAVDIEAAGLSRSTVTILGYPMREDFDRTKQLDPAPMIPIIGADGEPINLSDKVID